ETLVTGYAKVTRAGSFGLPHVWNRMVALGKVSAKWPAASVRALHERQLTCASLGLAPKSVSARARPRASRSVPVTIFPRCVGLDACDEEAMMTKTNAIAVRRGIGRITVASCGRHPRCTHLTATQIAAFHSPPIDLAPAVGRRSERVL